MTNKKDVKIYLLIFAFILIRLCFIFNNDLIVEEAYYWNYAEHLDWSYLDHPPMIALLIKFGTILFRHHEWAVRFMDIDNAIVLLVSRDRSLFANPMILKKLVSHTPIHEFWSLNQKLEQTSTKFYYQVGHINSVG